MPQPLTPEVARWLDRAWYWPRSRRLRLTAKELAQLILPARCAVCAAPGESLCGACLASLRAALVRPRVVDDLAELDVLAPRSRAPLVAAGPYTGVVAAALLEAKRASGLPLLRRLGPALARAVVLALEEARRGDASRLRDAPDHPMLLIPLPPSAGSLRRRGFWPVGELLTAGEVPAGARRVDALAARGPWARRALAASRGEVVRGGRGRQRSQKSRGRRDRASAVRGSLRLRRGAAVRGRDVVLVDDVVTSGASLAEAARVLRAGGARVVAAAVVAWVPAPGSGCADG